MSDFSDRDDDPRAAILRKAERDPGFRAALLADAKAAISDSLGIDVPADIEVSVHRETPNHLVLVLPAQQGELNDQQLSGVAGGAGYRLASTRMQRLFLRGPYMTVVNPY